MWGIFDYTCVNFRHTDIVQKKKDQKVIYIIMHIILLITISNLERCDVHIKRVIFYKLSLCEIF